MTKESDLPRLTRPFTLIIGLGTAIVAMTYATAVSAQTADPGGATAEQANAPAGDIVVPARKRNESLAHVPLAVSALTADGLAARGVSSTLQLNAPENGVRLGALKASLLHAVEIALEDGETEFADLRSAYEALPAAFKERLTGMIGEFSYAHARVRAAQKGLDTEKLRVLVPTSQHPIVRTHPETGAKSLFIGGNLERIVGPGEQESADMMEGLTRMATQARLVYRHRWAVHDLVIWDNRCTLHRATPYKSETYRRVMHRATVRDTGPTVADGVILTRYCLAWAPPHADVCPGLIHNRDPHVHPVPREYRPARSNA
jgi:hypothetical protein